MDNLDIIFIHRRLLKKPRTDNLNKISYLNVILAIRELNNKRKRSNFISIYIFLKLNKHTSELRAMYRALNYFVEIGYLRRRDNQKSNYYLTEQGKQELRLFNLQISHGKILHKKADKQTPPKSKLKRPKPII